jgi:tetratricopeptide (TPR) repeat protein
VAFSAETAVNQHYLRGQLLLEQGRFDLAVTELRQAVIADPEASAAHSALALALLRAERVQEALKSAEAALEKNPNDDYAHWIMALIHLERSEVKLAEASVSQAIELDPECPANRGLLARILCDGNRFEEAVAAADAGLALDAANDVCLTFRARALMGLGRKTEADRVADKLLAEDPEDAWNHCLRGEQLLEQGDSAGARVHFLEALRIDPRNNYARSGLATSLKARSPLYGVALGLLLRLGRLRSWAIWGGIILLVVVLRFGDAFVNRHPDWMVAYEGGKALLWGALILVMIANPVFDLLLRFDPEGRHALSPDELKATNWYLPCLGFGALCALWSWLGKGASLPRGMGMASFFLCFAVTQVFEATPGYVRRRMAVFTATAGVCLLLTPFVLFSGLLLAIAKHGAMAMKVILFTIWLPSLVMLYTASSEDLRHWLEKRRPDTD